MSRVGPVCPEQSVETFIYIHFLVRIYGTVPTERYRNRGRRHRRDVKESTRYPVGHLYILSILGRSPFPPGDSPFHAAVASAFSTEVESGAGLVWAFVFRHNQSKCLTYIKVSQNGRTGAPRPGRRRVSHEGTSLRSRYLYIGGILR